LVPDKLQVDRYINGDKEVRDRKLEILLQLGVDRQGLSVLAWLTLTLMSFLLRLTFYGKRHVPRTVATTDRTPIPAIKVASLCRTCHFGGPLQLDRSLPKNYVAHTTHLDSRTKSHIVTRILISYIEQGGMFKDVIDVTFVLAGEEKDELPERALGTFRLARGYVRAVALPTRYCIPQQKGVADVEEWELVRNNVSPSSASLYFRIFVTDPVVAAVRPLTRLVDGRPGHHTQQASPMARMHNLFARSPTGLGDQACIDASTTDPFERAVNELVEILEDVRIPVRKEQQRDFDFANRTPTAQLMLSHSTSADSAVLQRDDLVQVPILRKVNRSDILRFYLASDCKLKMTAVRLVESACWRGLTFPIDVRTCRLELQNAQFFQQGIDVLGNPVYYFRHTCLGPWRKDQNAVIAAVLHRLETSLSMFARHDPDVRCCLIVCMGRPHKKKKSKTKEDAKNDTENDEVNGSLTTGQNPVQPAIGETVVTDEGHSDDDGETAEADDEGTDCGDESAASTVNNPRIHPDEKWHEHTSKLLVKRLVNIVMANYPERLHQALVVVRHGNGSYARTAVGGVFSLTKIVVSARTRDKVKFLTRYADLQQYVAKDQLVTLVGGTAPINPAAFECR
jgi:CRAL/TRIO domain